MRNKSVLALLIAAMAISAFSLGRIAVDESAAGTSKNYQNIRLLGSVEANGVTRGLSEGFAGIQGLTEASVIGHFDRDVEKNQTIYFRVANLQVKLFINGGQVFSFGDAGPAYLHSAGNTRAAFVSPGISEQDEIRVELAYAYLHGAAEAMQLFVDSIYADTGGSFLSELLRNSLLNAVHAVFVACLGVLFLLAALVLRSSRELREAALLIGVLSVFSGVLFFIDFGAINLYLPLGAFWNGLEIVGLAVVEACIMLYLSMHTSSRLNILLTAVAAGDVLLMLWGAALQMTGAADYFALLSAKYVLLGAGAAAMLAVTIHEVFWKKRRLAESMVPVLVLGAGAVGDVVLYALGVERHTLPYEMSFLVFLVLQMSVMSRGFKKLVEEGARAEVLKRLAYRDPLTGVRNRSAYAEFVAAVNQEIQSGACYGAVVFDLNRLKQANDEHGHHFGDELIRHAAKVICQALKNNPVFRVGGDEFVAVLYEEDRGAAENLPKRLADAQQALLKDNPALPKVSVACGYAFFDPESDRCFEDVVARADSLMYQDKGYCHQRSEEGKHAAHQGEKHVALRFLRRR